MKTGTEKCDWSSGSISITTECVSCLLGVPDPLLLELEPTKRSLVRVECDDDGEEDTACDEEGG